MLHFVSFYDSIEWNEDILVVVILWLPMVIPTTLNENEQLIYNVIVYITSIF